MDTTPSNVAKAGSNEPHDLLARLYREIGLSAVAAALEGPAPADERAAAETGPSAHEACPSQAA